MGVQAAQCRDAAGLTLPASVQQRAARPGYTSARYRSDAIVTMVSPTSATPSTELNMPFARMFLSICTLLQIDAVIDMTANGMPYERMYRIGEPDPRADELFLVQMRRAPQFRAR